MLTLVMPAMGFSHPDQQSQRPDPVSQIGVLEGQMHDQKPSHAPTANHSLERRYWLNGE